MIITNNSLFCFREIGTGTDSYHLLTKRVSDKVTGALVKLGIAEMLFR